jgi:hypothetical protein
MRQERRRALLFPVLARNIEASRAEARCRRHESSVGQSVTREFGSVQATHARQSIWASAIPIAPSRFLAQLLGQPAGGLSNR